MDCLWYGWIKRRLWVDLQTVSCFLGFEFIIIFFTVISKGSPPGILIADFLEDFQPSDHLPEDIEYPLEQLAEGIG